MNQTRRGTVAVGLAASLAACGTPSARHQDAARPSSPAYTAATSSIQEAESMQIRITVGGRHATGHLYDTATARDFASLLPVTIAVHDLGGREKAGRLPRALADGQGHSDYRSGQLGYWAPSRDLAVYYREDGFRIPSPGIVMIGEIESGLDVIVDAADNAGLIITATEE
jgi:hypothetical protein